jgi:hypothetical protein
MMYSMSVGTVLVLQRLRERCPHTLRWWRLRSLVCRTQVSNRNKRIPGYKHPQYQVVGIPTVRSVYASSLHISLP